jgi:hypothetical protein
MLRHSAEINDLHREPQKECEVAFRAILVVNGQRRERLRAP